MINATIWGIVSSATWERFALAMHWIVQNRTRDSHDFLLMDTPNSNQCQSTLSEFKQSCQDIGVPIALEKKYKPNYNPYFLRNKAKHSEYNHQIPQDKLNLLK